MINNFLKLLSTGIVGLILFKHLETSATGEFFIDSSSFGSNKECPANNNSVCIKSYIHLVECFREITGNHENFSFAFFPNNKANSLYVAVTYTVHYSHNDSDDRIDYEDANSTLYIEEWVWSHTMVYIMFHPSLFKFLSIGYGKMSERTNSVRLTIPRLCHDNNDNHKLIERLTQMVCYYVLLVFALEDQSENQYYICHKASSVLYGKYSTVVKKYNTVISFNYSLHKQPSLMILVRLYGFLPAYMDSYHSLNGLNKEIHWNNILRHHAWLVFSCR